MSESDDELIRRLERLAAVTPTPGATTRAVDQVRLTLAAAPAVRRPRVSLRWAAIAATFLLAVGVLAWGLSVSSARAWADVQAAMKGVQSVTFREVDEKHPDQSSRTMLLANGLCRNEHADGSYTVCDFAKSKQLSIEPAKRTATLFLGINGPSVNLYELIKGLPGDASAKALPGKKMDGKNVLGFAIKVNGEEAIVWADPRTRLPVRIEMEDKDKDVHTVVTVAFDEFVFDKELDAKLFSFDVPEGYKLTTFGVAELPAASPDEAKMKPTVSPLDGIGPVKFGTSIADVEKLLGKADSVREVGKNGYTDISYASRGFFIGAGKTSGVATFTCVGQRVMATKVRDFAGQTDKGIRIGSSSADVIRVLGDPGSKEVTPNLTTYYYNRGQCYYSFLNDKLVQMTFMRPRPAK
jgi:outer membrane lipoprotein-sorting protein